MVICVIELAAQAIYRAIVHLPRSVLWVYIVHLVFGPVERVLVHFGAVVRLVCKAVVRMRS